MARLLRVGPWLAKYVPVYPIQDQSIQDHLLKMSRHVRSAHYQGSKCFEMKGF